MTLRGAMLVAAAGIAMLGMTAPTWSQQRAAPRPPAPVPQCDAAKFRVIVDVGHTPEIPGAISARGATEYDFNLRLAKVIERKLNDAGTTIVQVTHSQANAAYGRRVINLKDGWIVDEN